MNDHIEEVIALAMKAAFILGQHNGIDRLDSTIEHTVKAVAEIIRIDGLSIEEKLLLIKERECDSKN